MSSEVSTVGIAETKVLKYRGTLKTILGSCVGVCLYDSKKKIAGLSHVMLPEQKKSLSNPKKYADTAIEILIQEMEEEGAERDNLTAKIFGGAKMFILPGSGMMAKIGDDNIAKVRDVLDNSGIKIQGEDVAGTSGRTIEFSAESGSVKVKILGKEEIEV